MVSPVQMLHTCVYFKLHLLNFNVTERIVRGFLLKFNFSVRKQNTSLLKYVLNKN